MKNAITDNIEWVNLERVLETFASEFKNALQTRLLRDGTNASGTLVNSLKYEIESKNGNYDVYIVLEDYWKYVDEGREPTKNGGNGQLLPKIKEWIRIKPVIPKMRDGRIPTIDQLAFLITRKIHREGYEGTHFFTDTKEDLIPRFEQSIQYAIEEDFNNHIDKLLGTINF